VEREIPASNPPARLQHRAGLGRLRRLVSLRESSVFVLFASLMLIAAVVTTRQFVSEFLIYRALTERNVLSFLQQRTLPFRADTSNAILAAVQVLASEKLEETCDSAHDASQPVCAQINSLHAGFTALTGLLRCGPPGGEAEAAREACVESVARNAYYSIAEPYRPASFEQWKGQLLSRFEHWKYHYKIDTCRPSARGEGSPLSAHDQTYGASGCDPRDNAANLTKLFIPSRQNLAAAQDPNSVAPESARAKVDYSERIQSDNDFSMILEDLLALHMKDPRGKECPTCCTKPQSAPRADAPKDNLSRLVQTYFLTPDSLIRYWDIEHRNPADILPHTRLWGAGPFVEMPLLAQARFVGPLQEHAGREEFPETVASKLCAEIPSRPYIDIGGYGVVRTRCSCAVNPYGRLVGVFCTDQSIPILAEDASRRVKEREGARAEEDHHGWKWRTLLHYPPTRWLASIMRLVFSRPSLVQNTLITLRSVAIADLGPGSESCHSRIRLGDGTVYPGESTRRYAPQQASRDEDAKLKSAICDGMHGLESEYFQDIRELDVDDSTTYFFVPIARAQGKPENLGLILHPDPSNPTKGSLILMVLCWSVLGVMVVVRAHLERSQAASIRDESILRSLPTGVIDSQGFWIDYGNDRAEEVLHGSLRNFGAEADWVGGPRNLFNFIEPVFLQVQEDKRQELNRIQDPNEAFHKFKESLTVVLPWEIDLARRNGKVSDYYARLVADALPMFEEEMNSPAGEGGAQRVWIRVKGSPMFEEMRSRGRNEKTFATVQVVHGGRRRLLEQKATEKNELGKNEFQEKLAQSLVPKGE